MDVDYVDYTDDYTAPNETENHTYPSEVTFGSAQSTLNHVLVTAQVLISVLGLGGNALVIWICGWKMKTTVLTTWYISLAVSDFLFCTLLPLEVIYSVTSHWPFGQIFCKLASSALFLNMYSSVFLLVLITVDRCIMVSFPIWSQNHRTPRKAVGVVVLVWIVSSLLTLPSLMYRKTIIYGPVTQCHMGYTNRSQHKAVALTRFTCGFLLPFLVIVFCSLVLIVKLRSLTLKRTKPYKIMAALIFSFFFCWVPYHTFVLLELDLENQSLKILETGLKVGATLAAANTFISPVLYVFIGNDFKRTLKRSLSSRFEEAMAEDFRTGALNNSRSKSMEVF